MLLVMKSSKRHQSITNKTAANNRKKIIKKAEIHVVVSLARLSHKRSGRWVPKDAIKREKFKNSSFYVSNSMYWLDRSFCIL